MRRILAGALLALAVLLGAGLGGSSPAEARGRFHAAPARGAPTHAAARPAPRGGDDEGDAAKAVPGKGFTMENGVLTYPAPARFQPKNLPHR